MRHVWVFLLLLMLPAGLSAQRRGAGAGAGAGTGARVGGQGAMGQGGLVNRAALERQIVRRFAEQSSRAMGLGSGERGRLERILREGNDRRRGLAERGVAVRQRLVEAIGNAETPDAEFREILDEIDRLREEEHAQWRSDQAAIGDMLTPRQRAVFTVRWLRFQEVIRDVILQRPGPAGTGMLRDTLPPLGTEPAPGGI